MGDDAYGDLYRGMAFYEREAAARAVRETRQEWLPLLEEWLAKTDNLIERVMLAGEIRRLRRLLGIITNDDEARRAATRERVRQHRARKRLGIVLRPRKEPASPVTAEAIAADLKRQLEVWREIGRMKRQSPDAA
jgi:hypothetical protein